MNTTSHQYTCTALHGLEAYCQQDVSSLQKGRWVAESTQGEICVADRLIGPVGLLVQGPVSKAFDDDAGSWVEDGGLRHSNHRPVVTAPTQAEWAALAVTARAARGGTGYCEAWMYRPVVVEVVYTYPEYAESAQDVARALGVPARQVPGNYTHIHASGVSKTQLTAFIERLVAARTKNEADDVYVAALRLREITEYWADRLEQGREYYAGAAEAWKQQAWVSTQQDSARDLALARQRLEQAQLRLANARALERTELLKELRKLQAQERAQTVPPQDALQDRVPPRIAQQLRLWGELY